MHAYIDVNVSLGRWPFQRFSQQTPQQLAQHLAREGIEQAWVSAIESVLYPDPDAYDWELFEQLSTYPQLRPVKTVDPILPNWQESLAHAVDNWNISAVKLYPGYHQYYEPWTLAHPQVDALMQRCQALGLAVLIQVRIEDERNQYPMMLIPPVPTQDIADLAIRHPSVPVIALCTVNKEMRELAACDAPNLYVDIAALDHADVIATALESLPAQRLVFGSHTPFFYTRAAVMKMQLAQLPPDQRDMIAYKNVQAMRQLAPDRPSQPAAAQ